MERRKNCKNDLDDLLLWFSENGIISLDEMLNLGKEGSMNKVLQQFHKYDIYQGSDGRWRTHIDDDTKEEKRRLIVKTNQIDLINYLLNHYL